jgi:Family of unknown function (DUF5335)
MSTQEISREAWTEFFHGFSSAHHGWLATIEVFGSEFGAQVEVRELPFEGITADLQKSGKDSIALMVGRTADQHMTHTIVAPTHVRFDQTEEGANGSLQIESASAATTLVRFRSPAFPDLVPGAILE